MPDRRRGPLRRGRAAIVAALLVAGAACGSETSESSDDLEAGTTTSVEAGDDQPTATSGEEGGVATTRRSLPDRASSTDQTGPTSTEAGATTTASTADAGSPIDFAPPAGTELAIVGVQWDDTLNFRAGPGVEEPVVVDIAALPADPPVIAATGEAWQFPGSIWWQVTVDGDEVWASQAFLGMLGAETDITDSFAGPAGTSSLEAAADTILTTLDDSAGELRVRHVIEPLMFEVGGRAIVDVLGYQDDAVKGERFTIEVEPVFDESGDEPVIVDLTIVSVTSTPICSRGVSGGLCA